MSDHDARHAVLALLNAMGKPFPVAALLKASELLEIEAGAVRMALTRLKAQGAVKNPRRGVWELDPTGAPMHVHISSWRALQGRAMGWDGHSFLCVFRASRKELSQAQVSHGDRALHYLGFERWRTHVWVRPANLVAGLEGTRSRLIGLGLADAASTSILSRLDEDTYSELLALWDVEALEAGYVSCLDAMKEASSMFETSAPEHAARHAYEVGDRVIRTLATDPILPASMIDVERRAACIEQMVLFDSESKKLWWKVLRDLL